MTIIAAVIGFILKYASAFGALAGMAQKAADATKSVTEAMKDLHFDKRAKEIEEQKELGKNIIYLAAVEVTYNFSRGLLQVMIYAIMTWGVSRLAASMAEIGSSFDRDKRNN